mgnify:FL=1
MVTCKEIDDYLKYAEEHPKWINKKRKLLIENIVKPTLKRNDVFLMKKHIGTVYSTAKQITTNYFHSKSSFMPLHLCMWMTFQYFQSSSSRKDVEMVKMDSSCRW